MIKAIETQYKGFRFRSRLEARWAVFFDAVGLIWRYEPEGFDLGKGDWYLPDFYLPEWNQWVEIKPDIPSDIELERMTRLAAAQPLSENGHIKEQVILCGTPGSPEIKIGEDGISVGSGYTALTITSIKGEEKPFVIFSCFAMTGGGHTLDIWPMYFTCDDGFLALPATIKPLDVSGHTPGLLSLSMFHGFVTRYYAGIGVKYHSMNLKIAYNAARSARFEHGEKPQ